MLMDALRWNMLNLIRVELFLNSYKIWQMFINSSLQTTQGQYKIISLVISLLAHFAFQFDFNWMLTLYSIYLVVGACVWVHRRVYFYHRKLDTLGVSTTLNHLLDTQRSFAGHNANNNNSHGNSNATGGNIVNSATLSKADRQSFKQQLNANKAAGDNLTTTSANNIANDNNATTSSNSNNDKHTNSLQRQRTIAYRDFQGLLNEPRRNHKEFALSLVHLSHVSKLVADGDVFDEMHFQILATRRDVINLILRLMLFVASNLLMYIR